MNDDLWLTAAFEPEDMDEPPGDSTESGGRDNASSDPGAQLDDTPSACAHCGGQEFDQPEDTGRGLRAVCSTCSAAMLRTDDGQWTAAGPNSTDNNPSENPDPASGGVGGAANVDTDPNHYNDAAARHAALDGPDWCGWRHATRCTFPGTKSSGGSMVAVPVDRGPCPWSTAVAQQACPMSTPGPMATQFRTGKYVVDDSEGDELHIVDDETGQDASRDEHGKPLVWSYDGGRSGLDAETREQAQRRADEMNAKLSIALPAPPHGMRERFGYDAETGEQLKHRQRSLIPVRHGGYAGYVHSSDVDEALREDDKDWEEHDNFDEDLYDESSPDPTTHEREHHEEHGEYPDSYHERHDEAYGQALEKKNQELAPSHDDPELHNFIGNHGMDLHFWQKHAPLQHVDLKKNQVYATQPHLVESHLNRYLGNKYDQTDFAHGHPENAQQERYLGNETPLMVKHQGRIHAIEGHHRVAAELLRGTPSIRAHLFDADKHGFPEPDDEGEGYSYQGEHHRYAHRMRRTPQMLEVAHVASRDAEFSFLVTATWKEVQAKAARIRREGGVHITVASKDGVGGMVRGDRETYETILTYVPGSTRIAYWECGCPWAKYAWGRSAPYRQLEGRTCSHALALQYEAQSRGMFGKTVREDTQRPAWWDSGMATAAALLGEDADPADVVVALQGEGLTRQAAREVLAAARTASEQKCPHCGGYLGPVAFKEGKCPHCGHALAHHEGSLAPGWEGSVGPFREDYGKPHVYARDIHSGAGNCVCGSSLGSVLHIQAAPGVDVPEGEKMTVDAAKEPAAPHVSGVALVAADTGRVLMLQRGMEDEDDPARGTWEFPGGHIEDGDSTSLHGGIREWEEEVGQSFPEGGTVTHAWNNGIYQGHVVVVPTEREAVDFSNGRDTVNPDDPKGDHHEQSAWWDVDHARKNPALRPECKSTPWHKIKSAPADVGLKVAALIYTADDDRMAPVSDPGSPPTNDAETMPYGYDDISEFSEDHPEFWPHEAAAWDPLDQLGIPGKKPRHSDSENPASTGPMTSQDPPEWDPDEQLPRDLSPSTSINATLHAEPEAALPWTDGAEEDEPPVGRETYRMRQTHSDISELNSTETSSMGAIAHRSPEETLAWFHATAGAKAMMGSSKEEDVRFSREEVAANARVHLAGMTKEAMARFSLDEQQELLDESRGARARNFDGLNVQGTHYEALENALNAMPGSDDESVLWI